MERLESKVIQLLVLAAKIWTCSNIPQETPTKEWLREYLLVTLGSGVYDAWEKKDLIRAIYNYFTWRKITSVCDPPFFTPFEAPLKLHRKIPLSVNDLVAIYSLSETDAGVTEAIYDLAILAGLPDQPVSG